MGVPGPRLRGACHVLLTTWTAMSRGACVCGNQRMDTVVIISWGFTVTPQPISAK